MGNLQDLQDANLKDEDDIFQKPKKKRSDFRMMEWSHQMYAIQRYLEFIHIPWWAQAMRRRKETFTGW